MLEMLALCVLLARTDLLAAGERIRERVALVPCVSPAHLSGAHHTDNGPSPKAMPLGRECEPGSTTSPAPAPASTLLEYGAAKPAHDSDRAEYAEEITLQWFVQHRLSLCVAIAALILVAFSLHSLRYRLIPRVSYDYWTLVEHSMNSSTASDELNSNLGKENLINDPHVCP